jgi:K+-sensing histidine kinase KdpD
MSSMRRRPERDEDRAEVRRTRVLGLAVGGLGSVVVAVALVPLRAEIENANLALILVVVVVLAAIAGGRTAGAAAAVTATLAFDFFLTRPYLSMKIESADDIETVLILAAVGLLVGEVASRGRRSLRHSARASEALSRVQRVADRVARGARVDEVTASVVAELTDLLALRDCVLELPPYWWPLPRLERTGTIAMVEHEWLTGGFALPEDGVQLPVLGRGREVARLVLLGDPDVALPIEERIVAVALADQLGAAIVMASPEDLEGLGRPAA